MRSTMVNAITQEKNIQSNTNTCEQCRWWNYCHLEYNNLKFDDTCHYNPTRFSEKLARPWKI